MMDSTPRDLFKRRFPYRSTLNNIPLKNHLRSLYLKNEELRNGNIDIIMPTFNRSDVISEAIKSVMNQLHCSWSLYICDDGSDDSTREVCETYLDDPRINYLSLKHLGVCSARNTGIKESSSKYITFLDTDNQWSCEYLSLMITFLQLNNLDATYCAAIVYDDNNTSTWLGNYFDWSQCLTSNYIDLNCFMTKRSLLNEKNIGFDETLERFVDWDFILELTDNSHVSFLDCALVKYYNGKLGHRITNEKMVGEEKRLINYIREKHIGKINNLDKIFKREHNGFNKVYKNKFE